MAHAYRSYRRAPKPADVAVVDDTGGAQPRGERQREAFEFIKAYIAENNLSPSQPDIGRAIGVPGSNVQSILAALERQGFVKTAFNAHRAIQVQGDVPAPQPRNTWRPAPGATSEQRGTFVPPTRCFDCHAVLFGVESCPMCSMLEAM